MTELRLGIAGLGTVAQGLLAILKKNNELISLRSGVQLRVARVASRSAKAEVDLLGADFSTDLQTLVAPDVDVIVELIGGETQAKDLIEQALMAGKPVVTANKAVIANYGNALLAANDSVPLKLEAAVAGAIPIIQAVQHALVANEFEQLVGIINGTSNYILTSMQTQGAGFEDALATAQALGYAEADPTFDVEGIDAAHKLCILAALAFDTTFDFESVHVEGIRKVSAKDMQYAQELGYRIKHIGIAKRREAETNPASEERTEIEVRVHPALLPQDKLLANVNDVANAVLVQSDAAGQTLFSGPGAGGLATASAVLGDVVAVARDAAGSGVNATASVRILPIDQTRCANYLRIPVKDEPGVFAHIANVLSQSAISIEAAIQKEPAAAQDSVDIVILTGVALDGDVMRAIAEFESMPASTGEITRIRVEPLE